MANVIKLGVENPDDLLNAGMYGAGAIMRLQWSATEAGVYADVSGTGSTPTIPLVTLITAYTGYDPAGTSTTWYRTRYENVGATRLSDWSDPFLVDVDSGYCSLDDVKQDLEKVGDATADELLSDYIAQVTDYIRGYTGVDFSTTSGTYTFDGYSAIHGGRCLLIPRGIQSISLLEATAITGGSFTTIPSSAYVLRPTVQERTPGWPATEVWFTDDLSGSPYSYFPHGYGTIRITGVLGFGVPARIEDVARRTVVRTYASRQAGQADLIGSGGEGGAPMVSTYLSRRDRETLDSFKVVLVG